MLAQTLALFCLLLPGSSGDGATRDDVMPDTAALFRRAVVPTGQTVHWTFDTGTAGWSALHNAELHVREGYLLVKVRGDDPYIASPRFSALDGLVQVEIRARTRDVGVLELFWETTAVPRFHGSARTALKLQPDGAWHTYRVLLQNDSPVSRLRLDPGNGPEGALEIAAITLRAVKQHPIEVMDVRSAPGEVRLRLRNHDPQDREVRVEGKRVVLSPGKDEWVPIRLPAPDYVNSHVIRIATPGYPVLQRTVLILNPDAAEETLELREGPLRLRVHKGGTWAEVWYVDRRLAIIAPVVGRGGSAIGGTVTRRGDSLVLANHGIQGRIWIENGRVRVSVTANRRFEGPVVRTPGTHERAVFPGLEYLGRGEPSSSTADIEGPEHIRFRPDPLSVTIPLMSVETPRGTVSLVWRPSPDVQPTFLVPNRLDGPPGQRFSLIGTRIDAALQADDGTLDEHIVTCVQHLGLPELPAHPRDHEAQVQLCLQAINGVLWNGSGWGHCAEPTWERRPFADFASTLFWHTGKYPALPDMVRGGSHLRNDTVYFISGRAATWLRINRGAVRRTLQEQEADGAFRYTGPLARTHFENTASGYCASRAATLLTFAWQTGDREALEAGVRALEYMRRFRTPRGAQTWEIPLHTPDILASAHLVRAYVLGYRLTRNPDYARLATTWAVRGLPFVYLWSCRPIMAYATIAVFGATHWRAPVWIGRPVQWCGLVYADSLRLLAEHDRTLDWQKIALGILIAAEQMQYPDGRYAGCLPDSIETNSQLRFGPAINPCAILSLSRRMQGLPDDLTVLRTHDHVVLGPFPMSAGSARGTIVVHSRPGVDYELLIDGEHVLTVRGTGRDVVSLVP